MCKIRPIFFRSGSRRRFSSKSTMPSSTQEPSSSPARTLATAPRAEDEMERVFWMFDANGDGLISGPELAAMFKNVGHVATEDEVVRMMEEADGDGNGYISLADFAAINAVPDDAVVEEDPGHAFRVFDAGGNGVISPADLSRVLRGLGEVATVAQCLRMIQGVDRNDDGLISFDEFSLMMAADGGFHNIRPEEAQ